MDYQTAKNILDPFIEPPIMPGCLTARSAWVSVKAHIKALEAKVAKLKADSVPFEAFKKNCSKYHESMNSCRAKGRDTCTKQNCPIVGVK